MTCVSPLTTATVRATCKLGAAAECCRFLACGPDGMMCAKHIPTLRAALDDRAAAGTMTARGDNCDGLLHVDEATP